MIALQHLAKVRQVREFFLEFLAFLSNSYNERKGQLLLLTGKYVGSANRNCCLLLRLALILF